MPEVQGPRPDIYQSLQTVQQEVRREVRTTQAEIGVSATVIRSQDFQEECDGIMTVITTEDPYPEAVAACIPQEVVKKCAGYAHTLVTDPSGIVEACWTEHTVSGYEGIEELCNTEYDAGVRLQAHKCEGQEILMWTCDSEKFPEFTCFGF